MGKSSQTTTKQPLPGSGGKTNVQPSPFSPPPGMVPASGGKPIKK